MAPGLPGGYLLGMIWFLVDLPPVPPPYRPGEVRLQMPHLELKRQAWPRLGSTRNSAVVEVEASAPEDDDASVRLALRTRLSQAFKAPPASLGAMDLSDFMQENATGGTNYSFRTVRRLVDYWNPHRPPTTVPGQR